MISCMSSCNKTAGPLFSSLRTVAVTGMGIASAAGIGVRQFERALMDGASGIGFLTELALPGGEPLIGAELPEPRLAEALLQHEALLPKTARRVLRGSGKSVRASVLAAAEAWQHAGLDRRPADGERIGLVVAGNNISPAVSFQAMSGYQEAPGLLHPRYALSYMDTNQVGILSELFGIKGEGATVGGASASGNAAILQAARMIQLGAADVCLVVGALAELSPVELQGFVNIGAYGGKSFHAAPKEACRPFDSRHEGFILGEGAACLVLEGADSAAVREARTLSVIAGGASSLDGHSLTEPHEDGQVRTMEQAIRSAGIAVSSIAYINAHGTSTPLGDRTELSSIRRVFGAHLPEVMVNSTKAITGHCLYAAGVVEAVAVVLQMGSGFIHPQINLEEPVSLEHRFAPSVMQRADIGYALSNSYGFGGFNSSLIFKRGEW